MAVIIEMPKLSDTMKTGTLIKRLKREGDAVIPGDMLAEVETDKATMEIENFEAGVLLKWYVKEGQEVPIGGRIAAIGKKGEVVEEGAPEAKVVQPALPAQAVATEVRKASEEKAIHGGERRIKVSPLARKMAVKAGVALENLIGTGPGGRIVKKDILGAGQMGVPVFERQILSKKSDTFKLVSNLRATIARRLVESKKQLPHFYLNVEIDATPLADLREGINRHLGEIQKEHHKFTINDFILRGVVVAIQRVPSINVSWEGERILEHGAIHLAFGVAIEDGLVTPVIRDAQGKSLQQISAEARMLIEKARDRKLRPEEMSGSTFTVTNLGMYGIDNFYGIINPPNAAILSVGAITKKPVVDKEGKVVAGQRMNIGLSGDHRVIDGAIAAQFLSTLRAILETPAVVLL